MEIPYTVTARKDTGLFNSKVGIWLFLASEVMLFGGLFSGYVFLRIYADYPWPERALPVLPGLINTFVLIGSSVTVVFAWAALKMRQWRRFQFFMAITILCALAFMVLKGIEYNAKWQHQAVRMDDFTIIEGHTHKAKIEDGHLHIVHHGPGHEEEHGEDEHAATEFQANKVIFAAEELSFSVVRFHRSWIKEFLKQAEERHMKLVTAEGHFIYGNAADYLPDDKERTEAEQKLIAKYEGAPPTVRSFGMNSLFIPEGTPLGIGVLEEARKVFIEGRSNNAKVRTAELRAQWKIAHKENPGKANWEIMRDDPKAGKIDEDYIKDKVVGLTSTLAFKALPKKDDNPNQGDKAHGGEAHGKDALVLVLDRGWINRPVPAGAETAGLRDDTAIKGKLMDSPILLAVDAIDFRFVAQKATEAGKDPEAVIEKLWIFSDANEHADEYLAVWKKHQDHIAELTAKLEKQGRFPTDTEKYRVNWQDLVEYHPESKGRPTMTQGFAGPSHKNEEFKKAFLELAIPHEKVALESKFTPKWNTYYAIYFTLTGLHGLHVIGGALVLSYYLFFSKGLYRKNPEWLANRVEVGGLFWHFVDLVWIFLFPILYLM